MRITNQNFIADRSRPGLPTTATGIVNRVPVKIGLLLAEGGEGEEEDVYRDSRERSSGGEWRRRRGGRRLQRQQGKEQWRRVKEKERRKTSTETAGKGAVEESEGEGEEEDVYRDSRERSSGGE
ncbi:hypothetical protein C0J50_3699 [Silurus asotus]|uniref:Uncharacterized protein n=1 Tax=Silurus asotus TaxID=30991 RepID=A0AAD5FFG1_SILAS|nr:hypothetical protein C0J50_3699 [Silurus asotus]